MSGYEVTGSGVAYDGLSRVRVDTVRMPDGREREREVVEHPDAAAIVAVDDAGRVVLLRHYRHPARQTLLELPAGKVDQDGEDAAATARRELREETGLIAEHWEELVRFWNSAGWSDERTTVFLATGLSDADGDFTPEAEEADLEVVRVPLVDAAASAERGEVVDAKTIIGLLLARDRVPDRAAADPLREGV